MPGLRTDDAQSIYELTGWSFLMCEQFRTDAEVLQRPEVVEFDHLDHESTTSPWNRWTDLRRRGDIPYTEAHGGFRVLSRYEDVCAVARDASTFASGPPQGNTIPALPSQPLPPLHSDPPEHRIYRDILNPYFSPSKVRSYEPWIRALADGHLSRVLAGDAWNVPLDLGVPLTADVTFRVMGIVDAPPEVNMWANQIVHEDSADASDALCAFLGDELRQRREAPSDDLMSGLSTARFGDRLLSDDEIVRLCLILLLAGLETSASTIAGSVWYLLEHPGVAAELAVASADTWRLAMDEFVRWAGPVQALARTAVCPSEIRGYSIGQDERAMMLLQSANRDECEFEHPDDVILDRRPNRHVAFGMGPHRCLGSHLAKLELQVVLERLVADLDSWCLESPDAVKWIAGSSVRTIRSLPVRRVK
jgi:cytochrome P450